MNSVTQSPQERSPRATKEIYAYSVIIQSSAVDENNVPEDTKELTAYFLEPPFDFEILEWAAPWVKFGYRVVDKRLKSHQRFDDKKDVFVDLWNPPFEM